MAFSLAVSLSGLEMSEFRNLAEQLLPREADRAASPGARSDSSHSSGFYSRSDSVSITPISSRTASPSLDASRDEPVNVQNFLRGSKTPVLSFCGLNVVYHQLLKMPVAMHNGRFPVKSACQKKPLPKKSKPEIKVVYGNRDILNLGANVRAPGWQVRSWDTISKAKTKQYTATKSVHYKISHDGLNLGYPMIPCGDCNFAVQLPDLLNDNDEPLTYVECSKLSVINE